MKLFIFNGSPRKEGNNAAILKEVEKNYSEKGAEVDCSDLFDMDFRDCSACMGCKRGDKCVQKDELAPALDMIVKADTIIIGSPIYISAETAITKALIDRFFPDRGCRTGPDALPLGASRCQRASSSTFTDDLQDIPGHYRSRSTYARSSDSSHL